jgi:signal transduction histidine kinase
MQKPAIPKNEDERILALKSLDILDTEDEAIFDKMTKLAATICNVPIALISLVDENRQWFKSKFGLGANETPREISFCGHAINQNEIFCVEDSTKDNRFKDNPLVTSDPNVIFYAGHPLICLDGFAIGTLCVIDHKPRTLTELQKEQLSILSELVMTLIEKRKESALLKKQEMMIFHSSKMASLGEMASGIAHEINNPLTIIQANATVLIERMKTEDVAPEVFVKTLTKISTTSDRISKIIKGLQTVSRNADNDLFEIVSIVKLKEDILSLCEQKMQKESIDFSITAPVIDLQINCSEAQILQVLINLINNAHDAILKNDNKWIKIEFEMIKNKNLFRCSVTDSGLGIPKNISKNLMQPFFTTKGIGCGTGLGLSISRRIIERHDGIFYLNEDCSNTQFVFEFPLTSDKLFVAPRLKATS